MLSSLWASTPGLRCVVGMKGKTTHHYWFDSNDAAMAKAIELDEAGWDVYFTPAIFDPQRVEARQQEINPRTDRHYTGREQAAAVALPALWLDLDCGEGKDYPDQRAAAQALQEWLDKTGVVAPSYVVSSGYGLHVYWLLNTPAPPARWLPVAQHLKQACHVHGLRADKSRTADSASLLRPPGTRNHKRGKLAPVTVVVDNGTKVDLQQFRARLPLVGPIGAVPTQAPSSEWDTSVKLPPGDANKIADKCQQMGRMRLTKGKQPEPEWRAGLSILWRCEDAETLIHEWSRGDERYDPESTIAKAEATAGPATCRHFAELNPDGCAGCPYAGQISSPINIAFAEALPDPGENSGPIKVPGYTVTREGVFMEPAAEGGPLTKISDFPIWIDEARELAQAHENLTRATLILSWVDVRGRQYFSPLTQADLHDSRAWTTWLADNNLASFVRGPQMANYISKMHKVRFRDRGARTVYDCLGWYRDHDLFVTGCQGVTAEGVEDIIVDAKGPLSGMRAQGSLSAWKDAVSVFGQDRYRPHAFALLASFAAPLLDMVGKEGAVVALVGQSGKGKTLAAECGLSVYGLPKALRGSGRDSVNALGMYLGQLRHVPALVDEVTTMRNSSMRDLLYMAANGTDKATLTQKRERKSVMTWRTVTLLTSNHSIVDRHMSEIEEAHRRRLVEIPFLEGVTAEDGAKVGEAILANYGVAAPPYLQFVMKHKDKVPALFKLMEQQVHQWGYTDPADRFGSWTCSAALLGGLLAYLAGVIPFNPVPIVRAICTEVGKANEEIQNPEQLAKETLFELLTTHSKRICVWRAGRMAVETDDPIARVDGDKLYVRSADLHKAWDDVHIYRKAIGRWLNEVAPRGKGPRRLAPGLPPIYSYEFDMQALGWEVESLTGE